MPPQSRAAHVFAGVAVEIDLILKGIKTGCLWFDSPIERVSWK